MPNIPIFIRVEVGKSFRTDYFKLKSLGALFSKGPSINVKMFILRKPNFFLSKVLKKAQILIFCEKTERKNASVFLGICIETNDETFILNKAQV